MQYSAHASLADFASDLQPMLANVARKECYGTRFPKRDFLRFWLPPEGTRKTILYNSLQLGCKANPSFTYKLFFEGELLAQNSFIRDIDLMPDSLLVTELQ